jgi:hypothetical protein
LKTDAGKALVPDAPSNAAQRAVLLTVILLMIAAVVPSHQLTPFALALTTGALVGVGWCRLRGLPVIILIITLLWMVYMAVIFVAGHIGAIVDQVGALNQILGENLGGRLHGSRGHALIVHLRLAVTAVLWLAAGAGLLRRARTGKPVIGVAALALAPFPLLLIQPYGGEVLLRIGLFSLPFMALLAASLCMAPGAREMSWRGTALLALLGGLLVATFPFTRFGNERMDYYSRNEVAAVRELYRIAPRGSVLVSASDALPWRFRGYADYDYRFLTGLDRRKFAARGLPADDDISIDLGTPDRALLLRQVTRRMRVGPGQRSFLIITRSQKADLDMTSPWRRGVLEHVQRVLLTSSHFRVVLNRPDATILELAKRAVAA